MTDESAISHARRVQPSAFDRHDFDVLPARDEPVESPETTAFRLEVAIVALACTVAALLVL